MIIERQPTRRCVGARLLDPSALLVPQLSVHQLSFHQLSPLGPSALVSSALDSRLTVLQPSPPSLSPPSLFSLHSALSALGLSAHSPSSLSVTRSISSRVCSRSISSSISSPSIKPLVAAAALCCRSLPLQHHCHCHSLPCSQLALPSTLQPTTTLTPLLPSNAVGRNPLHLAMRVDENIPP